AALAEALLRAPLDDPSDEGLGLGLIVAQAIAEAHDGNLSARAIDADTVELVLELPAEPVPAA
ncbi:MAG: two-component sensor histidine kinase, partial [Pseudomonadota bacterium]|nr:two-component sensor histidine kinase [Pseudomonadota bacterium]